MMQATQHWITRYPMVTVTSPYSVDILFRWNWYTLVKSLMRMGMFKEGDIFIKETIQMLLVKDQHVIQTFSSNTADEAFTNRIRFGLWGSKNRSAPISHWTFTFLRRIWRKSRINNQLYAILLIVNVHIR
jgi:hypothetical protein